MKFVTSIRKKWSFFWQLFIVFLIIGLLPIFGVMFWQQTQLERAIIKDHTQQLKLISDEKFQQMEQLLSAQKQFVQQMSQVPLVFQAIQLSQNDIAQKSINPTLFNRIDHLFQRFVELHQYDNLFLINQQQRVVYATNTAFELGEVMTDVAWKDTVLAQVNAKAQQGTKVVVQPYQWHEATASVAAWLAVPIMNLQDERRGTLVVQMNHHWLDQFSRLRSGLGDTGEINLGVALHDDKVHVLNASRFESNMMLSHIKHHLFPLNHAARGQTGSGNSIDYRGEPVLATWSYHSGLGIGLVVKQDITELMRPLEGYRQTFWMIVIIVMLLLSLLALWLSQRLTKPMIQVARQVHSLGESTDVVPLPDTLATSYEMHLLITGINQTAQKIKDQFDLLNTQAENLEKNAAELSYLNNNLKELIEEKTQQLSEYIALVDQEVITSRTDLFGNITYVSAAFCRISGYSVEELIGKNHSIVRHPDMPKSLYELLWNTIQRQQIWEGEIKNMRKDGSAYWVKATISPTYNQQKEHVGYLAVRQDITDRKYAEHLSIIDEMTGLHNRRYFNDQMDRLWRTAARSHQILALIMLDVDYFKRYNDTQGHHAGDIALIAVADVLKFATKRATEFSFRLGGEEMAILALVDQLEDAQAIAHEIHDGVIASNIPHPASEVAPTLTVSIGICYYDGRQCHGVTHPDSEKLYQLTDEALYRAKENGRNRIELCAQGLSDRESPSRITD